MGQRRLERDAYAITPHHVGSWIWIVIATRASRTPCRSENTNLSTIEVKVKQSEMLEVGLRMVAFKALHEALAVLMPEQREKGKAAHEKAHEKRMHEMMSGRHGGAPSGGH